ncbi:MAG: T9SS type A sorting domain-containing protein [bacterium]
MKRVLLLFAIFILLTSSGIAQVLCDFEITNQGWYNYGWGPAIASVQQVADPTGQSNGVLQVSFDASLDAVTGTGAIGFESGNPSATTAQILYYYVWLPADTPDQLHLNLFAQDNSHWAHKTKTYFAADIPKEVWYPIGFPLTETEVSSADFNVRDNNFGWCGIDIGDWSDNHADIGNWAGNILIDNISYVGVEPSVFGTFTTGVDNFIDNGWGTGINSLASVADPLDGTNNVLGVDLNGTAAGVIEVSSVNPQGFNMVCYWLYLPTGVPDGMEIKTWAQDNANWSHVENIYSSTDIPKDKWYPIYFDMEAAFADPAINFDHHANNIGKMGIIFGGYAGMVYVDNASFIGTKTGDQWVVCDFSSPLQVNGFSIPGWGGAMKSLEHNTMEGGVMQGNIDLSVGDATAGSKAVIQRDNVILNSTETGGKATAITFDFMPPADMPLGGQVGFVIFGTATNWAWTEFLYQLDDGANPTSLVRGQFNTLFIDVDSLTTAGTVDPMQTAQLLVQIYYPGDQFGTVGTWAGACYFDNLIVEGIPKPGGELTSPEVSGSVSTESLITGEVKYFRFDWIDTGGGTETYNIYMSRNPITDLQDDGVMLIAPSVPHGLQAYAWRPYTIDGSVQTYYFAITASDGVTETALSNACQTGPMEIQTSTSLKAQYVADFANTFVLDGLDNEFEPYKINQILPQGSSDPAWLPGSADLDFKVTMVIDENNLYISADVTDDDLRTDADMQAWQGDALEFFMGFYDTRWLKELHRKNFNRANGDWRIGFTARGETALDGGAATTVEGVQSTVYPKFSGDGYIIEAVLSLDVLAPDGTDFIVINNMTLPIQIDCSDWDPLAGDTERSMIIQAGNTPAPIDLDQHWLRPHCWGTLQVIGSPNDVKDETANLPTEFKLYNNYPNPFNPTTTIKYDIKEEVDVTIKIYDTIGREIATLVNTRQKPGFYQVDFNAGNLASGMYVYHINAGYFQKSMKMMLLK